MKTTNSYTTIPQWEKKHQTINQNHKHSRGGKDKTTPKTTPALHVTKKRETQTHIQSTITKATSTNNCTSKPHIKATLASNATQGKQSIILQKKER